MVPSSRMQLSVQPAAPPPQVTYRIRYTWGQLGLAALLASLSTALVFGLLLRP